MGRGQVLAVFEGLVVDELADHGVEVEDLLGELLILFVVLEELVIEVEDLLLLFLVGLLEFADPLEQVFPRLFLSRTLLH